MDSGRDRTQGRIAQGSRRLRRRHNIGRRPGPRWENEGPHWKTGAPGADVAEFSLKVLGFKLSRFRQWKEVLDEERRSASLWSLLAGMLWTLARGRFVGRKEWRRRMRVCPTCPIFDRSLRRCRPYTGSPLGCGCVTWLLAMFAKDCYADQVLPDEKIGWTTAARKTGRQQQTDPAV